MKTIDDMETRAMGEEDSCANKQIRGEWLEVRWIGYIRSVSSHPGDGFVYKWGKNVVHRNVAESVLKTA